MLILSRRKNESLIINHDITITVVEIRGDKVRLGVEAPKEIPWHRNEAYEAIRRQTGPAVAAEEPATPKPTAADEGPLSTQPNHAASRASARDSVQRKLADIRRQLEDWAVLAVGPEERKLLRICRQLNQVETQLRNL